MQNKKIQKPKCEKNQKLRGASVDLDGGVDLPDEHVGGVEADRARQQPERNHHHGGVTEVQQGGDELHNVQLQHHNKRLSSNNNIMAHNERNSADVMEI